VNRHNYTVGNQATAELTSCEF